MSKARKSKVKLNYRVMDKEGLQGSVESLVAGNSDKKSSKTSENKSSKDGSPKGGISGGKSAATPLAGTGSSGSLKGASSKSVVTPKAGTSSSGAGAAKLTVAESLAKTPMTGTKPKTGSLPVENESDIDEEMGLIKEQMKQLDDEERRLSKSKKLQEMREELKAKQQKVKTLRGKSKTVPPVPPLTEQSVKDESDGDEIITIDNLRKNKHLKAKVHKLMKQFALNDEVEDSNPVDSESNSSYFESEKSDRDSDDSKKKKKKKKVKSGINAKAADRVKHPQRWPQAYLQFEFVSKQLKYDDLDMKQFIAGELGIISEDDISQVEKQGRIDFLKKIVYYCSMYEFKGLKAYYAAFVRDIERGRKTWSDDPSYLESALLNKYLLKGKDYQQTRKANYHAKSDEKAEKVWFCGEYQRNKCSHKSNHLKVVKGEQRLALHICASCWLKDKKKLDHPESSTACPHLNA